MQGFEYKVTAAPRRGVKAKGVRTAEERFARAVEGEMNRMASEGWDYVRSDILPCEERQGWFRGTATVYRTLLVFRRALAAMPGASASDPAVLATSPPPVAPLAAAPGPCPEPLADPRPAPRIEPRPAAPRPEPRPEMRPEPRPMPAVEPTPRPQPPRAVAPPLAPLPPRRTAPPMPEPPAAAPPRRGSLDDLLAAEPAPRDPRLDRWAPDQP